MVSTLCQNLLTIFCQKAQNFVWFGPHDFVQIAACLAFVLFVCFFFVVVFFPFLPYFPFVTSFLHVSDILYELAANMLTE